MRMAETHHFTQLTLRSLSIPASFSRSARQPHQYSQGLLLLVPSAFRPDGASHNQHQEMILSTQTAWLGSQRSLRKDLSKGIASPRTYQLGLFLSVNSRKQSWQ